MNTVRCDKNTVLHAVTNEEDNSFVGLKIKNGEVHFYYPESYHMASGNNKKELRRDVLNILRTITLAKSKLYAPLDECVYDDGQFALMSYLWIIRDYLQNGFYQNCEKAYKINAGGKVNWKKTLQMRPIISNGNVIFDKVVVEVKKDCDDMISEAHKLCVFESVRRLGWLFNISEKSVYVPNTSEATVKKYERVLKRELTHSFDDVKKSRLGHMLAVLSGYGGSAKAGNVIYGVNKYHYIYERMVDRTFGSIADIARFAPKAKWYLKKNDMNETEASSLRLDTVMLVPAEDSTKSDAYILDAKFYRFGTTGSERDLPATASIQKPLTYGDNVARNLRAEENIADVYNAFILPYNKRSNPFGYTENIEYIGYSKAGWRGDAHSHERVFAFFVDTKHLVSVWSRGNCGEDIEKLAKDIERYSK